MRSRTPALLKREKEWPAVRHQSQRPDHGTRRRIVHRLGAERPWVHASKQRPVRPRWSASCAGVNHELPRGRGGPMLRSGRPMHSTNCQLMVRTFVLFTTRALTRVRSKLASALGGDTSDHVAMDVTAVRRWQALAANCRGGPHAYEHNHPTSRDGFDTTRTLLLKRTRPPLASVLASKNRRCTFANEPSLWATA